MKTILFDTRTASANVAAVQGELSALPAVADRAAKSLGSLDDKLLVLRFNLGKLRAALERAFAPIAATVIPVVNTALRGITSVVNDAAKVIAALFGTVQEEAVTTTRVTGGAVKRSLADFDQIERLNGGSGGGSVETVTIPKVQDPLTPQLQAIVDRIRALMDRLMTLLEPLKRIDLTPAAQAFDRFRQSLAPITQSLFAGLEWAWYNLLVPLAQWTVEDVLPAFLDVLSSALGALHATVEALKPLGNWLWEEFLKPLGAWAGEQILNALENLSERLRRFGGWITEHAPLITAFLENLRLFAAGWTLVGSAVSAAGTAVTGTGGVLKGLLSFITGAFQADWSAAWGKLRDGAVAVWTGLQEKLRSPINGIIGFLNQLLRGITSGINAMIRGLNQLHFTVPDWVPLLGGESFGFHLSTVKTPQIPYLARGAVLPANQPFLAVVGDQKSGTNVEAPLSTIQEAVALVMRDQTDAILAGFTTSVEVQREILQAVLGIRIGDEVIAAAYDRYSTKLAVQRGG